MLLMDPSYQHHEVLRDSKASRVTVGFLDLLDLLAPWDQLDKKESMASLDAQVDPACLEGKETEETPLAFQDLQVLQVHLDSQDESLG